MESYLSTLWCVEEPDRPRRAPERDEPWRLTHLRLLDKRLRAGGAGMSKAELAQARLNHSVSVPIGQRYTPLAWDPRDERVAALARFRPKRAVERFDAHREVICDLVLRTPHINDARDRDLLSTLHVFFTWAEHHRFSTEPDSLMCGDRINPFVHQHSLKSGARAVHRWRLRFVASCVFPPPVESEISRSELTEPHCDEDLERFLLATSTMHRGEDEQRIKRLELLRDLHVLMALSFGAGCNGRMVHQVRQSWLHGGGNDWWLERPDRERMVPILSTWAPTIESLLTGNPDDFLLSPTCRGQRNTQAGKVLAKARKISPAFGDFDLNRASRHWQVNVLDRAGFAILAGILGYRPGSQTLGDLLPFLPPVHDEAARTLARRWTP